MATGGVISIRGQIQRGLLWGSIPAYVISFYLFPGDAFNWSKGEGSIIAHAVMWLAYSPLMALIALVFYIIPGFLANVFFLISAAINATNDTSRTWMARSLATSGFALGLFGVFILIGGYGAELIGGYEADRVILPSCLWLISLAIIASASWLMDERDDQVEREAS